MNDKKYWRSLDERAQGPDRAWEEAGASSAEESDFSVTLNRRSFLKAAGFSLGGAMLSACGRGPANKVISALVQPEEIVPGRAYWYASTCLACEAGCGVLVKDRDGRPLKVEGNPSHPVSRGGTCVIGQASVLGLYDDRRLKAPQIDGKESSWQVVDAEIRSALERIERKSGSVRFLSRTLTSPTLRAETDRFLARFGGRRVAYDPLSSSAMLDAHEAAFGARVLPRLRFERARVIASFDADFLGAWLSPVEFTAGYRQGRALEGEDPRMSRHIQFEPRMSLTGANADTRFVLSPRETVLVLAHLAQDLARRAGVAPPPAPGGACPLDRKTLRGISAELWTNRGESLVVCGLNEVPAQLLTVFVNETLGNYTRTLDLERPSLQREGDDKAAKYLLDETLAGKVDALFILGADPVAELPDGAAWRKALGKPGLVVSFADHFTETAALARFVAPDRHPLEGWGDCEAVAGVVSVVQPTIQALGHTRPALESLSAWGGEGKAADDIIREHWRKRVFPRRKGALSFDAFWNETVEAGWAEAAPSVMPAGGFRRKSLETAAASRPKEGLALALYAKVGMQDGRHAENPWLQELPDPVTKISWDNYASFSPATAAKLGITEGDVVKLSVGAASAELPAHVQPGQHDGVVAAALGYGRRGTERFADVGPKWLEGRPTVGPGERVGRNAAGLLAFSGGALSSVAEGLVVEKTGARRELACSQEYHTLQIPPKLAAFAGEKRSVVRETTLAEYAKNPAAGNEPEKAEGSLWAEHEYPGHRWGMAIDLGACTGCSACVVSCQAENNVPVVGKDEVRRRRDMYWLRLDRYYSDREGGVDVAFQPMLCQQCGHAPCETVCPVLATMHSDEGLNQQVYNRCVGTRYCENNCPYKVRRFNWFQYQKEGRLSNVALNPDVTVRVRGVMEKCSFCVQRIQEGKFEAKRQGRPLQDGEIQPACAQSCPARAIVFGDINDPKSRVSRLKKSARHYRVLAELNVQPSVGYMTKVRNRAEDAAGGEHG